jgi:hypothetical protein
MYQGPLFSIVEKSPRCILDFGSKGTVLEKVVGKMA